MSITCTVVGSGSGLGTIGIPLLADVPCSTPLAGSNLLMIALLYQPPGSFGSIDAVRPQSAYPVGAPEQYFQPKIGAYDLCHTSGIDWYQGTDEGFGIQRAGGVNLFCANSGHVLTDNLLAGTTLYFDVTVPAYAVDVILLNIVGGIGDGTAFMGQSGGIGADPVVLSIMSSSGRPGLYVTGYNAVGFVSPAPGSCCFGVGSGPGPLPVSLGPPWTPLLTASGNDAYFGSCRKDCEGYPCQTNWITQIGVLPTTGSDSGTPFDVVLGDAGTSICTTPFSTSTRERQWSVGNQALTLQPYNEGGVPYCAGESGPTGPTGPPGPSTLVLSTHLRGATGPGDDG